MEVLDKETTSSEGRLRFYTGKQPLVSKDEVLEREKPLVRKDEVLDKETTSSEKR